MTVAPAIDWQSANQRYLVAALGRVRAALERHAGRGPGEDAERELAEAADAPPAPSALDAIVGAFGLSPFERDVLLLCAGIELDGGFAELCAAAHGDPARPYPTFGLALAALADAHWSALGPHGPLRRWRLVETSGDGLTSSPLRIDERILHHLCGISVLDERLRGVAAPLAADTPLPASWVGTAERIAAVWSAAAADGSPTPLVTVCGGDAAGRRAVAAAACSRIGLVALAVGGADIPTQPAERDDLARHLEREALLSGTAVLVELDDEEEHRSRAAASFLRAVQVVRLVSAREPPRLPGEPTVRVDLQQPGHDEQVDAWRGWLGQGADDRTLEAIGQQFRLGLDGVAAVAAEFRAGGTAWDACRAQARPHLEDLAQRIEPAARWADLVLPDPQRQTLREIALHVRHRTTVYERWGFAGKGLRGLGISVLFSGPSGTGKTMAAEVLANELRLDLYRIDLSSVVSKYIGETEKNLRRVFDAAEEGGAILLFDEADALFGKRSEVKDSHDRYANIEVSYLLQRMEAYRGLAILTTNQKSALDQAFMRRIRFVVPFPFPDAAQRAEIWQRIFPAQTPTGGLDPERLAQLSLPGGSIRNIALNGAFLAADDGEPVGMHHLLRAAHTESAKLERPLADTETRGWS